MAKLTYAVNGVWSGFFATDDGSPTMMGSSTPFALAGLDANTTQYVATAKTSTLTISTDTSNPLGVSLFLDDPTHTNQFGQTNQPWLVGITKINLTGSGAALIDLTSTTFSYGAITITGGDGNYVLMGNSGNDTFKVGDGSDAMFLTGSNNLVNAGDGANDYVWVGFDASNNTLKLGDGAGDLIQVQSGSSNVMKIGDGAGAILSIGHGDNNTLTGGDGAGDMATIGYGNGNTIKLGDGAGATVFVGMGNGDINQAGVSNNNTVTVGDGSHDAVTVWMGSGNLIKVGNGDGDMVSLNGGDNNTVKAGSGNGDHISIGDGSGNTINVNGGGTSGGGSCGDGHQVVVTGANDVLSIGDGNNNTINAGNGDHVILSLGDGDNNAAYSGAGNGDIIYGGDGDNNLLHGGAGSGVIYGGDGEGNSLYGGQGNWTIYTGTGDDYVHAGAGSDTIVAGLHTETNEAPNDPWHLTSVDTEAQHLIGNGGSDLFIIAGADTISQPGSGTAITGTEVITGGAGADTFYFGGIWGNDVITDFNSKQGDRIMLGGVTTGAGGNMAWMNSTHFEYVHSAYSTDPNQNDKNDLLIFIGGSSPNDPYSQARSITLLDFRSQDKTGAFNNVSLDATQASAQALLSKIFDFSAADQTAALTGIDMSHTAHSLLLG